MPVCPTCQVDQLEGTFFCSECGGSLLPRRKGETTTSLNVTADWKAEPVYVPPPVEPTMQNAVRLTILNSGRRISLSNDEPILIGRQDGARGFYPDVDLTGDGGLEGGVSRRHARLSFYQGRCYVEDLESANGTFLNQQRLAPRTPHPLRSGDEIRIGAIVIRIDLPQDK